jgi:methylated-DNA-[protein]-cysteine S-methyltransferase
VRSPVGTITLTAHGDALVGLALNRASKAPVVPTETIVCGADVGESAPGSGEIDAIRQEDNSLRGGLLADVADQLSRYFAGGLRSFDVTLDPQGTEFQRRVWRALCDIPYGETRSYAEVASDVGRPKGARAVGTANNRNPIAILIPCHRVVGADGSLTGYAAGLDVKETLLNLERAVGPQSTGGSTPRWRGEANLQPS